MEFFKWLFGSPAYVWEISENGNPTMVIDQYQITVFQQDESWTYCIADIDKDNPYFSESFDTMEEAKKAALSEFE